MAFRLTIPLIALLLGACGGSYVEQARDAFAVGNYGRAISLYEVVDPASKTAEDTLFLAICRARDGEVERGLKPLADLADQGGDIGGRALVELARTLVRFNDEATARRLLDPRLGEGERSAAQRTAAALDAWRKTDALRRELQETLKLTTGAARSTGLLIEMERVALSDDATHAGEAPKLLELLGRAGDRSPSFYEPLLGRLRASYRETRAALEAAADELRCFESRDRLVVIAHRAQDPALALRRAREVLAFDPETWERLEDRALLPRARSRAATLGLQATLFDQDPTAGLAFAEEIYDTFGKNTRGRLRPSYAELLMRAERWEDLDGLSADWIAARPQGALANFFRGAARLMLEDPERALDFLTVAEQQDRAAVRTRIWLGRAHVATGREDLGIGLIESARQALPDDIDLAVEGARLRASSGEAEAAAEDLMKLVRRLRSSELPVDAAQLDRAVVALVETWRLLVPEDPDAARFALDSDPFNVLLADRVMRHELGRGDRAEARIAANRARNAWPELPQTSATMLALGHALNDEKLVREMLARLEGEVRERLDPAARAEVAIIEAMRDGVMTLAVSLSRDALAAHPEDERFPALLVQALTEAEGPAVANGEATLLIESYPRSAGLMLAAAQAAEQARSRSKALEVLMELVKLRPSDGQVILRALRHAVALKDRERIEVLAPRLRELAGSGNAQQLLIAQAYLAAKLDDEALEVLESLARATRDAEVRRRAFILEAQVRHRTGDMLGTCDVLWRMRVAGERDVARRLLVQVAIATGALEEAVVNARILGDADLTRQAEQALTARKAKGGAPLTPDEVSKLELALGRLEEASETGDAAAAQQRLREIFAIVPYRAAALRATRDRLRSAAMLGLKERVDRALQMVDPNSPVKEPTPARR